MMTDANGRTELPINPMPFIRAYPEFLFLDAIINQEQYTGEEVASVSVDGFRESEWTFCFVNASYRVDSCIHFYKKGFDVESVKAFYRPLCFQSDEVVFRIHTQQYSNRWDTLNIFINRKDTAEKLQDYLGMDWVFGRYSSGEMFLIEHEEYHWLGMPDGESCDSFRIVIREGCVCLEGAAKCGEWKALYSTENPLFQPEETAWIGCLSCQEDNQYYKWLAQNFIQLKFNANEQSKAIYSGFVRRNAKTYGVHPFIQFQYEESDTVNRWYGGLWNYLKDRITHNVYLQIGLNEMLLPGSKYYQREYHVHENLAYGFDESRNSVWLINIYNGKPTKLEVSAEVLEQAWIRTQLIGFRFVPDQNYYALDICHVYDEISDYLSGRNPTEHYAHLAEVDQGVFGIQIYDELLQNPVSFDALMQDIRVPYMILEHKKCMQLRFAYFYEMSLISEFDYRILSEEAKMICDTAQKIMLLVLKNSMGQNERNSIIIKEKLRVLRDLEMRCFWRFLHILEVL